MEDIAPGLLKKIQKDFRSEFDKSKVISELYEEVRDGIATYREANDFAIETGSILASAYQKNLSSNVLPDGKMYYNIAERIIDPTMANNYDLITEVTKQVQQSLNEASGIGMKTITPELNQDRIDGIINRVSNADDFDSISWLLNEAIVNFSQSIVDDSIRENAEFQSKAGLQPVIIRKTSGSCCAWCAALAGKYRYPDEVPRDVYRRHQRCRCTVDYDPGSGKIQNVHSKQWRNSTESDKIKARKNIAVNSDKNVRKTEYRKNVGTNGLSYSESRALTNYVSSDAYIINDKLRRNVELTDAEKLFCENLDSALKKMPTYAGNLSRSLYFYSQEEIDEFLGGFKKQEIITFKEYISTTKGTELYNPDGQVQLYVQNSTKGRDLSGFNRSELEVLYERETKFKVESIKEFEGIWYVLLEEG